MLSSNAFFNRIPISHECLDNPVRKRWVLTGAGIQGSRLVTLGRLALLNCILLSHKYFSNPAMKQGVLLEQESKEAGLVSPSNPQRSAISSSNKPQISGERRRCRADKQAAASLPKKHAVSLISKPQSGVKMVLAYVTNVLVKMNMFRTRCMLF